MIKHLAAAAILSFTLGGAAFAQAPATTPAPAEQPAVTAPAPAPAAEPAAPQAQPAAPADAAAAPAANLDVIPTTADACIDAAASLGQTAEGKTFSDATVDKLDQLFSKMESACDGKQFSEAMAIAKDIKTAIEAN
ncbi:MAG: hypothetical protein R3D67_16640 [Hyphomicrobiaceae bacterium]